MLWKSLGKRFFSYSYSSCQYKSNGIVSPFFASMLSGGLFTTMILSRMNSNYTRLISKIYELEKDIKNIKDDVKEVKDVVQSKK